MRFPNVVDYQHAPLNRDSDDAAEKLVWKKREKSEKNPSFDEIRFHLETYQGHRFPNLEEQIPKLDRNSHPQKRNLWLESWS